jgi:hypothetical protein
MNSKTKTRHFLTSSKRTMSRNAGSLRILFERLTDKITLSNSSVDDGASNRCSDSV